MAIQTKKYAAALYQAVKESQGKKLTEALANFVKLLIQNRLLGQADTILADFKKYYNEQEQITAVEGSTARPLKPAIVKDLTKKFSSALGQTVELNCQVNPELCGGAVFRIGDYLIDGSVAHRLNTLRQKIYSNQS